MQELKVSVARDEQQLQANPLFSPELAAEKQPPTPPVGGSESRMAALRLDCEAALVRRHFRPLCMERRAQESAARKSQ